MVRITLPNVYALGQEFFRWEIATAVAGSIIGINAFNQPDVEASKIETKKLTSQYETTGSLPPESPFFIAKDAKLFADDKNSAALSGGKSLNEIVKTHLSRIGAGDYFALLGYIPMNAQNEKVLQTIRLSVRDAKRSRRAWLRPRFSLYGTSLQRRAQQRRVPADYLRRCERSRRTGTEIYFGVVKAAQPAEISRCWQRAAACARTALGKNLKSGLNALAKAVSQSL